MKKEQPQETSCVQRGGCGVLNCAQLKLNYFPSAPEAVAALITSTLLALRGIAFGSLSSGCVMLSAI